MVKILNAEFNLCTGCRSCEIWCAFKHHQECNPHYSRIRVVKFDQEGLAIPIYCLNCKDPKCQDVCPANAIRLDEKTGALLIDLDQCTSCQECIKACAFSGLQILPDGTIVKCDLCGGDPVCVKHCESGALKYVEAVDFDVWPLSQKAPKFILPYLERAYKMV